MENVQKSNNIIIVRIDEMIHWVMKRVIWIILAGVLFAVVGGKYASNKGSAPMYRTTAKLYVTGVQTAVPSSNSFVLGKQVITSYIELMRSRPVMEQVIENLNLNMSSQQLKGCMSLHVPVDTCMLEVTVEFPDAQWAKWVVDEIIEVSSDYALEVMGCTPPTVYEEAGVPTAPYNVTAAPVISYAIMGGIAGIALAGFFVLVTYFINTKFNTPGKAEDKLGVPVWGVVPKEKKLEKSAKEVLVSKFSYESENAKIVSFVRATSKENSYNLMKSMSDCLQEIGKRTILIDTNLNNPMWSAIMQESPESKGLHEYLVNAAELKEVVLKKEGEPDMIPCGNKALNSGELLKSNAFHDLLERLSEEYDYVFLDVPPIQYSIDAFAVLKQSELILWTVSAKRTKSYVAKNAKKKLADNDTYADGLILTELSVNRGGCFFKKKYGTYVGLYKK